MRYLQIKVKGYKSLADVTLDLHPLTVMMGLSSQENLPMREKTCIVTGATSGHGKGVALGLARQGVHVLLVCRNPSKGAAVKAFIEKATGNQAIDLLQADLSSLANVKRLADTIQEKYDRVSVLVNNAGIYRRTLSLTQEGVEETFAVNYLAHFLLTRELIDTLRKSAPARVINVTSSVHRQSRLDIADVLQPRQYDGARAYRDAKLAIVAGTFTFAEQLQDQGVSVNCLTPGAMRSDIIRDFALARLAWKMLGPFLPGEEQGAQPAVRLALSQDLDGVTGKYFEKRTEAQAGSLALKANFRRELFDWSASLVDRILESQ